MGGHPAGVARVGRFGPCLQGAGTEQKGQERGVGRWGGVGVGEVGTRERHRGYVPRHHPDNSPNQLDWRLIALHCTDWTDDFDFNLSG